MKINLFWTHLFMANSFRISFLIFKLLLSCDEVEECSDTLHSMLICCLELNRRCDSWITNLVAALKESPGWAGVCSGFENFISWDWHQCRFLALMKSCTVWKISCRLEDCLACGLGLHAALLQQVFIGYNISTSWGRSAPVQKYCFSLGKRENNSGGGKGGNILVFSLRTVLASSHLWIFVKLA